MCNFLKGYEFFVTIYIIFATNKELGFVFGSHNMKYVIADERT
jgi:hypothetical protein